MEEKTSLEQKFADILLSQAFESLDHYKEASSWAEMTHQERTLLAILFISWGEKQLAQGDNKAVENFDLSLKVSPNNAVVYYRLALAYSPYGNNMRCLMAAAKALETATTLEPTFFAAWSNWGCVLLRMGSIQYGERNYFLEAHEKFEKAFSCLNADDSKEERANLYCHWGLCWYLMGKASGEAHDFHIALDKYRLAAEMNVQNATFWNDYGNVLAEMALLVGRKDLFIEAAELFRKAIKLAPDYFQSWCNLACSFQRAFEFSKDLSHFQLSEESFSRAAELNSTNADLWISWGQLHADVGKERGDLDHMKVACEKYARADQCEGNNPFILARWSEILMLLGTLEESLEKLRSAEEKIIKSLELQSDNPDGWWIYGSCLMELGTYFSEEKYYIQSIEKFRYGLTLKQNHSQLWYGLAQVYFALGDLNTNPNLFEQAVSSYGKAIEFADQIYPQYWNDLGVALMQLAEMLHEKSYAETAIEKFEYAIKKQQELFEEMEPEFSYNYACALDYLATFTEEATEHEEAIQILTKLVEEDPSYSNARYNLSLALMHLGALTDDVETLRKALEHFQILLQTESEDELSWNDWGLTLLHLVQLVKDPTQPEVSKKLYEEAEAKLMHSVALGCNLALYNLACLYSLAGNFNLAMNYIERADAAEVLPPVDELLHDEWLEPLRETPEFRNFVSLLASQAEEE